jgi:hypothetical protein
MEMGIQSLNFPIFKVQNSFLRQDSEIWKSEKFEPVLKHHGGDVP